jgi:hypothetical protein
MHALAKFALPTIGVLLLASCSGETTRPEDARPNLTVGSTGPLACHFPSLKQAARDYFASTNDPIFLTIEEVQILQATGSPAAVNEKVFDALSRLADVRFTSAQKSGSTGVEGDLVARGLLGCAAPDFVAALPTDISFVAALNGGGLFEVRGNDAFDPPTLPVYSKGGSEIWTALPQGTNTWGQSASSRHLLYGTPTSLASNDEQVSAQAFEFTTVPVGVTYSPAILRGVCDIVGETFRIQRNQSLLPVAPIFCPTTISLRELRNSPPVFLAFAERLGGLFRPARAEATMLGAGMAGLSSEFSPHVLVDLKEVVIAFVSQPQNGFVNQPIPGDGPSGVVEVQVTSLAGTPLPGVSVTLVDWKNRGTNVVLSNATAVTDDGGIASFPALSVNKAGGYTLLADGTYDGIPGTTATSALFNIKNK